MNEPLTIGLLRLNGQVSDAGLVLQAGLFSILRRARRLVGAMLDGEAMAVRGETVPLPPGRRSQALARLAALPRVLTRIATQTPGILRFVRTGDRTAAAELRRKLGLDPPSSARPVPAGLFGDAPPPPHIPEPPVILIPVFNAFPDVAQLLDHLPGTLDDAVLVLLVDDGSDDPRIAPLLAGFRDSDPARVTLLSLPDNRGFVGAVNAGLAKARDLSAGHVILLNSDTLPPGDWVPRLLAPILSDPGIATVTPVSNNAEILSVPAPGIETAPDARLVDALDLAAQRLAPAYRTVAAPTGIGFCMAMNRRFLDAVGPLDPAFGRGYGEEVDWCQKARAIGGRHVAAAGVFVAHRGGASFGDEKAARLAASARLIAARYPGYDAGIADWSRAEPLHPQRLALATAWLGAVSPDPVPVWLGHSLGGGAEMALDTEIAAALAGGAPGGVVIRTGGPGPWRIELRGHGFEIAGDLPGDALLHDLLTPLIRRRVVYSCGVGAADPAAVPRLLSELTRPGDTLELRLHDYFPVSPSYCLLGSDGRYHGVPEADGADPVHTAKGIVSLAEWRVLWSPVIARADRITCFSEPSRKILETAYPAARGRTVIAPHRVPHLPEPVARGGAAVGVLGGINAAKGGEVLERLARHLGRSRRIAVIGQLDPAFRLPRPHLVHGSYRHAEIAGLARAYGVGVWLMPSVWPETFSFTTREVLATGLPVLVFPLGAQAEAVAAAPNGRLLAAAPDDTAGIADEIEAAFGVSRG